MSPGTRSVAIVGAITAMITGGLLWMFRPAPQGKIVPLLIGVSTSGRLPSLRVMNGVPGAYDVEVTGGESSAPIEGGAGTGEPAPSNRISWRYSGPLSRLSFSDILQHGERTGTAAQIHLPSLRGGLEPGSYVIEISGRDKSGNSYAGAQSFSVGAETGNPVHTIAVGP